jgi:ATP-dependent Clp protease protease subunit
MAIDFSSPSIKNRNLYLSAQVDQHSMESLSKQIVEINQEDKKLKKLYKVYGLKYTPKPIKIHIDSYGGAVYQCFGLLGIMENSKTPIYTIVTGCAMSCGFMIAISGHKRFAYTKATLLYHQLSTIKYGKLKEIKEDIIESKRLQKMIENIVIEKTKITRKRLKESFNKKEDWFISVDEALELGVIDKIK